MRGRGFERFAWFFVAYLVAVILFGAWVRITHSGAGCGSHWPTCHGEIIPPSPAAETFIEYTHRLTSGFCGILGLVLVGWAWRLYGKNRVFWAASLTLIFIIFEGAIGAGLVLGELVADDDSVARAAVIALHLTNTLALTASASLTAWWAGMRPPFAWRSQSRLARFAAIGLLAIVLTCMTGAVTALGDTLFPSEPAFGPGLVDKIRGDLSAANHFLVRMRALHPAVALAASAFLTWFLLHLLRRRDPARAARRPAWIALGLVWGEVALGLVNVVLAAPGWMQLIHLLAAQALWVSVFLTSVAALSPASEPEPVVPLASRSLQSEVSQRVGA